MPKQQSSLDSFFGGGAGKKKKNPQTKLDSFFGKNKKGAEKENNKSEDINDKPSPSASSDKRKAITEKSDKSKLSSDAKRRRRVIEDSDDEEMHFASSKTEAKDDATTEKQGAGEANDNVGNLGGNEPTKAKNSDKDLKTPQADKESENKKQVNANDETTLKVSPSAVSKHSKAKKSEKSAKASDSHLPYSELCEAFESIEATSKRLQIQEIVTNLFRKQIDSGKTDNLYPLMYLASSSVAPAYECVELGIGDALLIKAIAEAYGSNTKTVKTQYEEEGDLGLVAQNSKGKQKTLGGFFVAKAKKPWSCQDILSAFRDIANIKGGQSQKLKTDQIKKLLVGATHRLEPKYIIRALQGKLRIGLAASTVLISLAHALTLSVPPEVKLLKDEKGEAPEDYPEEARNYVDKKLPKEKRVEAAVAIVRKAYNEVSSYDKLIDAVLSVPLEKLHLECSLKPGLPVQPMLAKPTKSIQEVLKRLNGQRFTAEFKYDGERAQIHMLPDGSVSVFSRNLLDTTAKYRELESFVKEAAHDSVGSCVLDTEVVAWDSQKEKLVPFQVLSTRKKSEESAESATVKVIVQAFDLMYLNNESLLGRTLQERRELLHKHFSPVESKFTFAVSMDHVENGETLELENFLEQAVKGQCEGLMVKTLDVNAIYEPSKRSLNWLKLKKDYLEGMGDSVDLVPIGAYHGKGKRTGVYGAYLLACYDPDSEEYQSVCKIGTGFSDEDLKTLASKLNEHTIPKKTSEYNVTSQLECDVWFSPVQVWEVKAADLSKSSTHRGAVGQTGEEGRGIGLRFPRFIKTREDKRPIDATSSHQILDMYYNQDSIQGGGAAAAGDDDDDGI